MRKERFAGQVLLVFIALIFKTASAQTRLPDDVRSPINYDLRLTGTFGELRSNHFHAGIDVKSSRGVVGDSLFAIADGYISRIMVHPSGYGNAIAIEHHNGMTSLYAHLDRFENTLYDLIKKYQEYDCSYYIDYNISPEEFPVKKGQLIGFMGNTGYSFGPHLHFEIARTESDMLINPLHFGLKTLDKTPPELHILRTYGWDNQRRQVFGKNYNIVKKKEGHGIYGDTIRVPADRAALAIASIDKADGLHHRNGIYRLEMYLDDRLHFSYQMDSFPREDRRALNAHADFEQYMRYGNWFHRLHRLPGNPIQTLYPYIRQDGLIRLDPEKPISVKILVYDFFGNFSICTLVLKRDEKTQTFEVPEDHYLLHHDKENLIEQEDLRVFFPKKSLYEDLYLKVFRQRGPSWSVYSPYYRIHHSGIPLHHNITISIRPENLPASQRDKVYLAYCNGNAIYNHGGTWDGEFFKGPTHQFGDFCLMVDTIPPTIKPTLFSQNAQRTSTFRFQVYDDVSTSRHISPTHIEVYINRSWAYANYDSKTRVLQIPIKHLPPGEHQLWIIATDPLGNERQWQQTFSR